MDAIIGKYRVDLEETGLILKHQSGISFDLTVDETLALMHFLNIYREAWAAMKPDTDRRLESIILDEEDMRDY